MKILLALLLVIACSAGYAETPLSDKDQLNAVLKERKDRFDGYMTSLQNKSGLFGGKTKKDLLRSQEILVEIVRLDNRLINILNRQLDFKSFEKTELTYQSLEESGKLDRLTHELALSHRKLEKLQKNETTLRNRLRMRTGVMFIALATTVVAALISFYYLRKKDVAAA